MSAATSAVAHCRCAAQNAASALLTPNASTVPRACGRRQCGVTLISLMVGLVVSMLVVVATLVLYQNLVRATSTARGDAQLDAQSSAAFLSVGMGLQDAGFGIAGATAGTHLMTLRGASLGDAGSLQGTIDDCDAADDQCNAVLWEQNIDGVHSCAGLLAPPGLGGMVFLNVAAPCNLTQWASSTWTQETLSAAAGLKVLVTRKSEPCSPFGIVSSGQGSLTITLQADNSNGVELKSTHCLINFPPASP